MRREPKSDANDHAVATPLRRAFAVIVLCIGCASSSEDATVQRRDLDCLWLRDPNNCYRRFVTDVAACVGSTNDIGTIDVDRRNCRYASGARSVVFNTAWIQDPARSKGVTGDANLHFTVYAGDDLCLEQFEETGSHSFRAHGRGGTLLYEESGDEARVTCPDGTMWSGSLRRMFGEDGACPADRSTSLPATSWSQTWPYFAFTGSPEPIFRCYFSRHGS